MRMLSLFVVCAAALTVVGRPAVADVRWMEKEKEHKRDSGGGGGEFRWRDPFSLDGYVVYDYTIQMISVRGGGTWWGSDLTENGIKVVGTYLGVDTSRQAELLGKKAQGGPSSGPYPDTVPMANL